MAKLKESEMIMLGHNYCTEDKYTNACKNAVKVINYTVFPVMRKLGVVCDLEHALSYARDYNTLRDEYVSMATQGVENLPPISQKKAIEEAMGYFYSCAPSQWCCNDFAEVVPFLRFKEDAKSTPLDYDRDALKEACVRYVQGEEQIKVYTLLKEACEIFTRATKGKCANDYFDMESPVKCEGGVWSVNGDFINIEDYL